MRKHVVFVVDASRSMEKCDVVDEGISKRRIDAVLDACFEFMEGQLRDWRSSAEDRYSIISFNDVAKIQLRGKRMGGRNLNALRKDLKAKIRPTHGTCYGAGLASAWEVALGGADDAGEQFVLIFLSDGRPRDMNSSCKREQIPAAWLRVMRERFCRRLTLHGVGVGPEDFELLEELCAVAGGTFHQAMLGSVTGGSRNAARAPVLQGRPETLSITLSQMSSSVSSLCLSSRMKKCFALEDVEEATWNNTHQDTYYCDKLSLEGNALAVQMQHLKALVRERPFAEGGMRHCFRVWDLGPFGLRSENPVALVGKQSKFYLSVSEQLTAFEHDLRCHALARQQADQFNRRLESFTASRVANNVTYSPLRSSGSGLEISECVVYRLEDEQEPGGFRYLLVEPFLEGKYFKYNGNNGYVASQSGLSDDQRCWWQVAQAFSHFTHHNSSGNFLVCDMQGVDRHITDPAIHSKVRQYGDGDRGSKGIRDFLETHRCNAICRHLDLPAHAKDRHRGPAQEPPQLTGLAMAMHQETFYQAELASGTNGGRNAAWAPVLLGRPETLSNPFGQISSSVSSVCLSTRSKKCFALEDVGEAKWNSTHQDTYFCDKLSLEGNLLVVQMRQSKALVRERPFAEGGMRHCFRAWDLGPLGLRSENPVAIVGKQSKFYLDVSEQLTAFKHDLRCHALARQQADQFNHHLESFTASRVANNVTYAPLRSSGSCLEISECVVYRLEDEQEPGGFRYLLVEPFLEGKYLKYNGNNGYVASQSGLNDDQRCWWQVAQAFSHFTHHNSSGNFLVCDMQGVDRHMTDPAIHSKLRQYGDGDRGNKGMRDFLDTHRCNAICRYLDLPSHGEDRYRDPVKEPPQSKKPSSLQMMQQQQQQGTSPQAGLAWITGGDRIAAPAAVLRGRPETLSNIFGQISSSVCSVYSSSRMKKCFALEDVEEATWNTTHQDTYFCERLSLEGDVLIVQMRHLKVLVRERPFAEGGMRHCFRTWDLGPFGLRSENPVALVGKQSKFYMSVSEQLVAFKHGLRCHALARQQADEFNRHLESFTASRVANNVTYAPLRSSGSGLEVSECVVYRLEDEQEPGGLRYLLVEPFLEGKYLKYNGNNGYVVSQSELNDDQRCWWQVAQAYSHFTHHNSAGNFLVCDIQGVGRHMTDPAIHSKVRQYGDGDRGSKGMRDFLETHRCNAICRHLDLPCHVEDRHHGPAQEPPQAQARGFTGPAMVMHQGTFRQAELASVTGGGRIAARAPALRDRPEAPSNTFGQISSSAGFVCSASRMKKCFALEDVEEAKWNSTHQDTYFSDKLSLEGNILIVQMRHLKAVVRERPFAEGGMRHCFRVWDLGPFGLLSMSSVALVGKQSKFYLSVPDQLTAFKHDLRCHALARQQANQFNRHLESFTASRVANNVTYSPLRSSGSGLEVSECVVYRLEDEQEPGGFRYLLVEPFLEGKYLKYNGNNGYVASQSGLNDDQRCWWQVAQAFSHFTHHNSAGNFLVCDMQGVDRHMTDPAIHSKLRQYGDGDRGTKGMRDFLDTHRCNAICRHLDLPSHGEDRHRGPAQNPAQARALGCTDLAMMMHQVIYEEDEDAYDEY